MPYGPLVISLQGKSFQPEELAVLQHPLVGGVILFGQNYQNKEQLIQLTTSIKTVAQEANKNLLIMADQEGGYVQRFRMEGFSAIPSAKSLGEIYNINPSTALEYAAQLGTKVGYELKSSGVDVILGPVVDLDMGNKVISGLDRAYHADPAIVTEIAGAYIQGLEKSGMRATLKHFPGHGADIGDSHEMQPLDHRTWEELTQKDLVPFKNLIETETIGAVMPAHVTYPHIDENNTAGTSKIWLSDILRDQLHFAGVIISDCLSMAGAGENNNLDKTLKVLEYSDMALLSHQSPQEYLDLLQELDIRDIHLSDISQQRIESWLSVPPAETPMMENPPSYIPQPVLPELVMELQMV